MTTLETVPGTVPGTIPIRRNFCHLQLQLSTDLCLAQHGWA